MKLSTAIWLPCLLAAYGGLPVLERAVVHAASGVAFTHRSRVEPLPPSEFRVVNEIRNDSRTNPLSVRWDWGRIACTGFLQLPPGATDSGGSERIVATPIEYRSEIRFGVDLKQTARAQVYVDRDELDNLLPPKTSGYLRRNADGTVAFRVEIYSGIYDRRHTKLQLRVDGGLSLALPKELGGFVQQSPDSRAANGWKITEAGSLAQLEIRDASSRQFAGEWLGSGQERGLVVLEYLGKGPKELTAARNADSWKLHKVNIIGFNAERTGVIGFTADVYLP
jgi:hypothetical protein